MEEPKRIYVNIEYRSLEEILKELKYKGIFNNRFKDVFFGKRYDACYYESDSPDFVFEESESSFKKRLEKFKRK